MITPQDIREKVFERAVRGYDMETVDEFLDDIAADYTALVKENSSLKSKMRVLVEKIEEYRQTEDSMRLALLSAQKMSSQIEAEAKEKAESIVAEAQAKADAVYRDIDNASANERAKFEEAKKATQKYIDHMTAVCQKQIEFYEKLADAKLVKPAAPAPVKAVEPEEEDDEAETVRSIAASVNKAALREPEDDIMLGELVAEDEDDEEEEPTRMFKAESAPRKRKRSRAEYAFEDDDY